MERIRLTEEERKLRDHRNRLAEQAIRGATSFMYDGQYLKDGALVRDTPLDAVMRNMGRVSFDPEILAKLQQTGVEFEV